MIRITNQVLQHTGDIPQMHPCFSWQLSFIFTFCGPFLFNNVILSLSYLTNKTFFMSAKARGLFSAAGHAGAEKSS